MKTFEQLLPDEDADIREIVTGMLHAQARFAAAQHRPLGRGTHTKGVCVRGSFEIFDLTHTVTDPFLRGRLAQGIFGTPGSYPATVRFANAESTVQADYTADVRAVSFAVELPAGVVGPAPARHDFSMNNATTFPINDAHAFAVLMRVLEAPSVWRRMWAFASLSPSEWGSLLMTGLRGAIQKLNSVHPYQLMRYWSGVPFRHGPNDAVKYSLIAHPRNPATDLGRGHDMLRNELIRHVDADEKMSEFDFAIQFLDPDRMRHLFRKRDAIYWVENASVEWPENEAPFHVVGRLTLDHASRLTDDECQQFYIDVTDHSTPTSQPLGSINRARGFGESASRRARLNLSSPIPAQVGAGADAGAVVVPGSGAPVPAPAAGRGMWLARVTLGSLARAAVIAALVVLGLVYAGGLVTMFAMLPAEHPDRVEYPDRGWGAGVDAPVRQTFYYTPQGAGLEDIRYSWFVNLEMPLGSRRFADPSILSRYGFLVDPMTVRNPDRLPVGFTHHFDPAVHEEMLDVTCAACHTGQIQVTRGGVTRAIRIDGGEADHAFTDADLGHFLPTLIASMTATWVNPFKFIPFAKKVLGRQYPDSLWSLHSELRHVIGTFVGIAWTEKVHGLSPTKEGYGRTDALTRISNTVFGQNLSSKNYAVGNGPVSYPPLWNIWKFDWVQYSASVSQPMARNIAESMGVGAKYSFVSGYGGPLPDAERFRSTSLIQDLNVIENTLRTLEPPVWDPDILGPIDTVKAKAGMALFNQHCVGCHGPHLAPAAIKTRNAPLKTASQPEWLLATLCVGDIGTDPNTAVNFANARVDITRTGMTAAELRDVARRTALKWNTRQATYLQGEIARLRQFPDSAAGRQQLEVQLAGLAAGMEQDLSQLNPASLPVGDALSYLGTLIREKAYADGNYTQAQQDTLDGFGALDMPQIIEAYRSRPLGGMWATPPFLHNGSVPTVYDLLSPPDKRPTTFEVGSHEFDPVKLGLAKVKGFWTFDTRLPGNHNTGHEFGVGYDSTAHDHQIRPGLIGPLLSEDEKMAIIEYLKVRDDDRDGPKEPKIPGSCSVAAPTVKASQRAGSSKGAGPGR